MDLNWRQKALDQWTHQVCLRPGLVLVLSLLLAAAAIGLSVAFLRFQPDRNALISPRLDWNQRFEAWRQSFTGNDDMYVVVDTGDLAATDRPERLQQAGELVRQLGEKLAASPHVEAVLWGMSPDDFTPRTLRLLDMPQFDLRLAQIRDSRFVLENATLTQLLQSAVAQMNSAASNSSGAGNGGASPAPPVDQQTTVAQIDSFITFVNAIDTVLSEPASDRPSLGELLDPPGDRGDTQHLTSPNGRMFFLRVTPRKQTEDLSMFADAIGAVRALIDEVAPKYPGLEVGLTGIDVIESDETAVASRDAAISSVIALVLISVLLVTAFHSWKTPMLTLAALLIGVAWSFGFTTLAIGYLQVISIIFAVILLGLGIALGIHVSANFELCRHHYPDTAEGAVGAIRESIRTVGEGVITGAITTAAAFATTLLTDFKGVAEMGLIAGAGVMLCLLAMLATLPAMLRVFRPYHHHIRPVDEHNIFYFHEDWVMPFARRPKLTLALAAILTLLSLAAVAQMRFDYDLLKVFPKNIDSLQWQQRVVDDGEQSIWTATSIAPSLEAARDRVQQFRREASAVIGKLNGIAMLFPPDDEKKVVLIEQVKSGFGGALAKVAVGGEEAEPQAAGPEPRAGAPDLAAQLSVVRFGLYFQLQRNDIPDPVRVAMQGLGSALDRLLTTINSLDPELRARRMQTLQGEYSAFRVQTAGQIESIFDTSPLTPADVPAALLAPYIASKGPLEGHVAIEIFAELPADSSSSGVLDPIFLPRFIHDIAALDQNVTGVVVQVYRSGDLIKRSYQLAGLYALLVVFALVWVDFRNLHDAVLALVPVAVGFALTFGVLELAGISINPANIIVLPLMFGIGVDAGVHVIHRYRQNPDARPLGLTRGTGKAITLTSLTTMIGFGSMLFAEHRGIASLALVLTVGIGLTLFACWTIMPAWLELRARKK